MPTWLRYLGFQVPGWIAVAALLGVAVHFAGFSATTALTAFALWLAKDAALYPLLRRSYEHRPHVPAEHLIGARAIAQEELAPAGYVRVGSELWRARLLDPRSRASAGSALRVREVRKLELRVERESGGAS